MDSNNTKHILFLDDDEPTVFLTSRMLERHGYRVTGFRNQQQAIAAVRADPSGYDLLLTDLNMPGISGIEVATEVLHINPDLRVVLTSGVVNDAIEKEAKAAGILKVMQKPDSMTEFCKAVEQVLE